MTHTSSVFFLFKNWHKVSAEFIFAKQSSSDFHLAYGGQFRTRGLRLCWYVSKAELACHHQLLFVLAQWKKNRGRHSLLNRSCNMLVVVCSAMLFRAFFLIFVIIHYSLELVCSIRFVFDVLRVWFMCLHSFL